MNGAALEARDELAERMLPVATHLVMLVHGDGGPQDVQEVFDGLGQEERTALIVVLAALVDPDRPVGSALWWLRPPGPGGERAAEPEWPADAVLRDLATPTGGQPAEGYEDIIDQVAVEAYLRGLPVQVTPRERLEAVVVAKRRGMDYPDIDVARGLRSGATSKFVSRIRKSYAEKGLPFPEFDARSGVMAFSVETVVTIRRQAYAGDPVDVLAARYGVTTETIRGIVSGRRYRAAGGPIRLQGARLRPGDMRVMEPARWLEESERELAPAS